MKTLTFLLTLTLGSLAAQASDFDDAAISLAEQQTSACLYHVGEEAPVSGRLYTTYGAHVDWRRGYTTVFVGKRKANEPRAIFSKKITAHIDTVTRAFSAQGLRGYLFIVYGNYEIAFQNWTSEADANAAFATEEGKAIASDAGSFMDPSLFGAFTDFSWLNGVSY